MRMLAAGTLALMFALTGCDEIGAVRNSPSRVDALEQKLLVLEKALASARAQQAQVATGTASCKAAAGETASPVEIAFPAAFARPPAVSVALAGATASGRGKAGLSLFIEAADVTEKGFLVRAEAPPGANVSDCAFSWIAVLPPASAPS